ncbi:MAG: hypothetical protein WA710_05830, partial [Pseudolabrys sp.]
AGALNSNDSGGISEILPCSAWLDWHHAESPRRKYSNRRLARIDAEAAFIANEIFDAEKMVARNLS